MDRGEGGEGGGGVWCGAFTGGAGRGGKVGGVEVGGGWGGGSDLYVGDDVVGLGSVLLRMARRIRKLEERDGIALRHAHCSEAGGGDDCPSAGLSFRWALLILVFTLGCWLFVKARGSEEERGTGDGLRVVGWGAEMWGAFLGWGGGGCFLGIRYEKGEYFFTFLTVARTECLSLSEYGISEEPKRWAVKVEFDTEDAKPRHGQ